MEPVVTLRRLRELVLEIDNAEQFDKPELADEMAELFDGLDNWLKLGGYSPWPKQR